MSINQFNSPTVFVVFGATGDLFKQKLIGAIFNLYEKGLLPNKFSIVGFSRREIKNDDFRKYVSEILISEKKESYADFLLRINYVEGNFENLNDYGALKKVLDDFDKSIGQCSNKLFYLATPPAYYENIFNNLAKSGLADSCGGVGGWTRVLVEKPFGNDLKEAEHLEKILSKKFKEEQIYRIDHYLTKETVQNLLMFRFANSIFEPVWNSKYIESISVRIMQKGDINGRGAFYDGVGALNDMGQTHTLQMLALVTMDTPKLLENKYIRNERANILKNLSLNKNSTVKRGQYEGYKNEKNVREDSDTETYFYSKLKINTKKWRGTDFYIESGKALNKDLAEIVIDFRPKTVCLSKPVCDMAKNEIKITIQPDEDIKIKFWVKKGGFNMDIEPRELSFSWTNDKSSNRPSPYEKLIFDAVCGDSTAFPTTKEIEYSWKFVEMIKKAWQKEKLFIYKKGSVIENGQIIN
jgi:glucose-6-phosphate 1-dehydrogenase